MLHESDPQQVEIVEKLAIVLTATPSARAKLFANPLRYIVKNLPARRHWRYTEIRWSWWPWRWHLLRRWVAVRNARKSLAQDLLLHVADEVKKKKLASTVNTDAVYEESFAPIVSISRQSFTSVFGLSLGAFVAGLALIGSGVYIAIFPPSAGNSTVLAGIFGGSGAISALASIYTLATSGIRHAALDHARLAMVMTSAATQLGPLRALADTAQEAHDPTLASVTKINEQVSRAIDDALAHLPTAAESEAAAAAAKSSKKVPVRRRRAKANDGTSPGGSAPDAPGHEGEPSK